MIREQAMSSEEHVVVFEPEDIQLLRDTWKAACSAGSVVVGVVDGAMFVYVILCQCQSFVMFLKLFFNVEGIASLVNAQTWNVGHTGSNADSFVGQGWPLDFGGHARLYRNCSLLLLDGNKVEYINWHSEVDNFPTWGCVVGTDRTGRLSFSVPRPGTKTAWQNLAGQLVLCHNIGVRMWKTPVLRDDIPEDVKLLRRQWDTGMTLPELSVCDEPCHICKSSSGAVACPLCLLPAHHQCLAKVFDCMQQDDVACMTQGQIVPARWVSRPCLFCKTVLSLG